MIWAVVLIAVGGISALVLIVHVAFGDEELDDDLDPEDWRE